MNKHSLFNSFLLAVCLAVMGWVAHNRKTSLIDLADKRPSNNGRYNAVEQKKYEETR